MNVNETVAPYSHSARPIRRATKIRDVTRSSVGGKPFVGPEGGNTAYKNGSVRHIASDLLRHAKKRPIGVFEASLLRPNTEPRSGHRVGADRLFVFFYGELLVSKLKRECSSFEFFLLATIFCYSVTIDMLMGGLSHRRRGREPAPRALNWFARYWNEEVFPVASLRPIGFGRVQWGKSVANSAVTRSR